MKPKNQPILLVILTLAFALLLTGCSQGNANDAASAIQAYFEALVSQDEALLVNSSCAEWEEDAILELDSLSAVSVSLENFSCSETGQEGEARLVACTGNLIADYNGEEQAIDLAERAYIAVQEDGEWRMCGYR